MKTFWANIFRENITSKLKFQKPNKYLWGVNASCTCSTFDLPTIVLTHQWFAPKLKLGMTLIVTPTLLCFGYMVDLGPQCSPPMDKQMSVLDQRSIGLLVHWSIGPLVHQSVGPLVQCQMSHVNKIKLLSERISRAPPVIFKAGVVRAEYFYLSRSQGLLHFFSSSRAVILGALCRNIGQEQLRVTQSCGAAWI